MNDRWDVKCREVYMDNSQKYQIWLNGVVVGEIVNRFDAVEKLRNVFDTIEALQQENEQLRAQAARMREALKQIALYDEYMTGAHEVAKQALSDTPADYHNPADVELLRKARKALHKGISELKVHCKYFDQTPEEDACIEMHEAVVEIDKAIGGGQDE